MFTRYLKVINKLIKLFFFTLTTTIENKNL